MEVELKYFRENFPVFHVEALEATIPLDNNMVDIDTENVYPQGDEIYMPGSWCLVQFWSNENYLRHEILYTSGHEKLSKGIKILYRNTDRANVIMLSQKLIKYWYNTIKLYAHLFPLETMLDGYYLLQVLTDACTATYEVVHSSEVRKRYIFEWVNHAVYGMIYLLHENDPKTQQEPVKYAYILHMELCQSKLKDILKDISVKSYKVLKPLNVKSIKAIDNDDIGFTNKKEDEKPMCLKDKIYSCILSTVNLLLRIEYDMNACLVDKIQSEYVMNLYKFGKFIKEAETQILHTFGEVNFIKYILQNTVDLSKKFLKAVNEKDFLLERERIFKYPIIIIVEFMKLLQYLNEKFKEQTK